MPEKSTCVSLIVTCSLSTLSTVTGASSREANLTERCTPVVPCAHKTAQRIVASSMRVCRSSERTEADSSRSCVSAKRVSEETATLALRSRLTKPRAAAHQWRCAASSTHASYVWVLHEVHSPRSMRATRESASPSLVHSRAVVGSSVCSTGDMASDSADVAARSRHSVAPFSCMMHPCESAGAAACCFRAARYARSASASEASASSCAVTMERAAARQASARVGSFSSKSRAALARSASTVAEPACSSGSHSSSCACCAPAPKTLSNKQSRTR
mmetsp:Transcript_40239/g.93915  ORF Transcript_40239/g.93915 Transcript_40239/m.93915 type:complete len:274 (+) Transcript_40239:694-1515(+)